MEIDIINNNIIEPSIKPLIMHMVPKMPEGLFRSILHRINKTNHEKGDEFLSTLFVTFKKKYPNLSVNVRNKFLENFIYNSLIHGVKKANEVKEKHNLKNIPYFFVISPTMRCNLNCYGCYAGEYSKKDDLPFNVIDRILTEAKEMGIYFITISGGEPFIRKDMLDLYEKHNDMYFQIYTNGTLIDAESAFRLSELGNILPCISVEGFERETEKRRGKGAYRKILGAMDNLSDSGCLFGFSATATRENNELIVSDEFIDFYQERGCFMGWYFNYIPIGKCPQVDMMPTAEQRINRKKRLNRIKEQTKDIVLADFWNDGYLVGGCIAGGRVYFHINVNGDVEPCVFCHFAKDNIKTTTLFDAVNSDFFKSIRDRQPYNNNHLIPCMIIDNNEVLREVVKESKALPTHEGAEAIIEEPITSFLRILSSEYKEMADKLPYHER